MRISDWSSDVCSSDLARENEAPIAIAAIDIAVLVDLEEHARMAERAGNTVTAAVAGDAAMGDSDRFGRRDHGWGDSKARCGGQSSTDIPSCQRKLASPEARDPSFRWGDDEGWRDNQTILDAPP